MDLLTQIKTSADFILKQSKYKPEIGLILGSGLGSLADTIEDAEYYNYSDIPNEVLENKREQIIDNALKTLSKLGIDTSILNLNPTNI